MAAGRAESAAERVTHRLLAEKYAEVVRQLMQERRGLRMDSAQAA